MMAVFGAVIFGAPEVPKGCGIAHLQKSAESIEFSAVSCGNMLADSVESIGKTQDVAVSIAPKRLNTMAKSVPQVVERLEPRLESGRCLIHLTDPPPAS